MTDVLRRVESQKLMDRVHIIDSVCYCIPLTANTCLDKTSAFIHTDIQLGSASACFRTSVFCQKPNVIPWYWLLIRIDSYTEETPSFSARNIFLIAIFRLVNFPYEPTMARAPAHYHALSTCPPVLAAMVASPHDGVPPEGFHAPGITLLCASAGAGPSPVALLLHCPPSSVFPFCVP
jgi:hypothetical protein